MADRKHITPSPQEWSWAAKIERKYPTGYHHKQAAVDLCGLAASYAENRCDWEGIKAALKVICLSKGKAFVAFQSGIFRCDATAEDVVRATNRRRVDMVIEFLDNIERYQPGLLGKITAADRKVIQNLVGNLKSAAAAASARP